MRCLSESTWGSSKKVLLILHKSLILSKLDYCSFVYAKASASSLKRIDTIQYKSLIIVTGGMKGTALKALLGECGEIPMKLRREKILLEHLFRVYENPRNSASSILLDKKFFNLQLNVKSEYKAILNSFLSANNIVLNKPIVIYYLPRGKVEIALSIWMLFKIYSR